MTFFYRFRIFLAMTFLVIIAFGGIALLTIPQYKEQSNKYHEQRLERKQSQLQRSISYVFQNTPTGLNEAELDSVFKEKIFQIADVQNVNFSIYSLDGRLLNSTLLDTVNNKINDSILIKLNQTNELNIIHKTTVYNVHIRSSYSLILDIFSIACPPGYPKLNIFAVLSNASPSASSIVVPNCS